MVYKLECKSIHESVWPSIYRYTGKNTRKKWKKNESNVEGGAEGEGKEKKGRASALL